MATCPNCGAANVTGKFCSQCGAAIPPPDPIAAAVQPPVSPQQPIDPPIPRKNRTLKLAAMIAGGVVGLAAIAGALFYFLYAQGPKDYPATLLAQGTFDFPGFEAYDVFGGRQIALARSDGQTVYISMYEFKDYTFKKTIDHSFPFGQLLDVSHGPAFNDGKDYSFITATEGTVITAEDGDALPFTGKGLTHALIGDWDGAGQYESAFVKKADGYQFNILRYNSDRQNQRVATGSSDLFVENPRVIKLKDPRSMVLGSKPGRGSENKLLLQTIFMDLQLGRPQIRGEWEVPDSVAAAATAWDAANLKGKDTLLIAYQSSPSYVQLFDGTRSSNFSPESLGAIRLPDGRAYNLVLGAFTQDKELEVLVFNDQGEWFIYGL